MDLEGLLSASRAGVSKASSIRMPLAAWIPIAATLILTRVLGLSYAEAAEICGCPLGTIRSRVARARKDLIAAARRRPGRLGRTREPTADSEPTANESW